MESECFVVVAVVVFLSAVVAISLICGVWLTFSLPFCFQKKKEQEMERKRKEKEEKVSFGDTFKPHPPILDKDRLMKKLLLDYFHSRNGKLKHYFKPL